MVELCDPVTMHLTTQSRGVVYGLASYYGGEATPTTHKHLRMQLPNPGFKVKSSLMHRMHPKCDVSSAKLLPWVLTLGIKSNGAQINPNTLNTGMLQL